MFKFRSEVRNLESLLQATSYSVLNENQFDSAFEHFSDDVFQAIL